MPYNSHIIAIQPPSFDWDPKKSSLNIAKHGVSFFEARQVFYDPLHLMELDVKHSCGEERYRVIGSDSADRVLVVVYCLRDAGSVIRIISARKATRQEREGYRRCARGQR